MSKIVIGTLILAILIICSPFILRFFEKMYCYTFELGWLRGEKTKEEVVKKYMEGLKTGNSQTIERLIPKTHEADKEIREKIEKFQGADFSKVEIYYKETPFPAQAEIKNIKLENGETASDEISITRDCSLYPAILECKKWYLIMGTVKEGYGAVPEVPELKVPE
ncbi:MAG: hypothetical protein COS98_02495 [Parcubacteria group bacterium CG07_land_8_20_14_0_80_35_11]|nr:MAG: hypothetical protein COS98_02495 [Parcubacteria group bacterium CG07_land_8_20_14_0_80_35_11]